MKKHHLVQRKSLYSYLFYISLQELLFDKRRLKIYETLNRTFIVVFQYSHVYGTSIASLYFIRILSRRYLIF